MGPQNQASEVILRFFCLYCFPISNFQAFFLSGNYSYEFESSKELIILIGKGAWMEFLFLGSETNYGINVPDSVAFNFIIEQMSNFHHREDGFWTFKYARYQNWDDEPTLI